MSKKRSRLVAMIGATALGAAMLAGVNLFGASDPGFYLEGLRLQNVIDGNNQPSIQAFVDVYLSDVEKFTGGAFLLKFNSDYWVPSDYTNNLPCTGESSKFISANSDLYAGTNTSDPFMFQNDMLRSEVRESVSELLVGWYVKTVAEKPISSYPAAEQGDYLDPSYPNDKIEVYTWTNPSTGLSVSSTYLESMDKVKLGTLSFRVDPDNIAAMTAELQAFTPTSLRKSQLGAYTNEFLYPLQKTSAIGSTTMNGWGISHLIVDAGDPNKVQVGYPYGDNETEMHISMTMPSQIIGVAAAEEDVTINAYEAYTDATPADLAAALQRYSSTVRLTYPNGDQRDEAFFWGNDLMTVEDVLNPGVTYEFQYTGSTYTWTQISGTPTPYDPRQGEYIIKQDYHYVENGQTLTFPKPVEVHLTVTPVEVIGITADNLKKSYRIDDPDLPDESDKLELPKEGRLVFDTILGGTIPAMPLSTWVNTTGAVTLPVTSANMGQIKNTSNVSWPTTPTEIAANSGVGDYEFECADPTQTAIQLAHPWATVNNSYTVQATRVIKPDTAVMDEYIVTADVDDLDGYQIITVKRKDGALMQGGSTFEVYRPDGVKVEQNWFGSTIADPQGYHGWQSPSGTNYQIITRPGDTSGSYPNSAEREICRRHINLGGYFTVVVHETGHDVSDPIKVYQRRRQNAYISSYTVPDGGLISASNGFEFDFTGHKAGLYPFHRYSVLPTTVVLPLNTYKVATRYDGITGAEPGEVRSFAVGSWTALASPSGNTAPTWQTDDVITHGPSRFSDKTYAGNYGLVENPLNHVVTMKVQSDDELTAPVESLLLTYEGTPAPSNIMDNGTEVTEVIFDTRTEGYPGKQEFELTLTNNGTTDIHGIYVDTILGPTQNPVPDGNQHFEIIKAPATDLAPGASTTFIISYNLGLPKNYYKDNIYVQTSSGLTKTFVARFRVVDGKLYKLTVQTFPEDGSMGTGGAVTGVSGGTYYKTPVGGSLAAGDPVWISVKPKDGYDLKKDTTTGDYMVYYKDGGGTKHYLTSYVPSNPPHDDLAKGEYLFELPGGMPSNDLTIYVEFYETFLSKLRLSDLTAYAEEQYPPNLPTLITPPNAQTMYDMTDPTYGTTGFDMDHFEYEVVIPADADTSGLKLTLYDIVVPYEVIGNPWSSEPQVLNAVIKPTVEIWIDDGGPTRVLHQQGSIGSTSAASPTTPDSMECGFASPEPGEKRLATITVTYYDPIGDTTYTQTYKVTFIRRTEIPVHTFGYGNTPYGMIMNAKNINNKSAAKSAYVSNGNRYAAGYVPNKAQNLLEDYIYWPRAWEETYANWPSNWGEKNLDRNDYALVAYVGEKFDDPGIQRLMYANAQRVQTATIKRSLEVVVLDPTATAGTYAAGTTAAKFNSTQTAVIQLTDLNMVSGVAALTTQNELENWEQANGKTIRPGLYALKYEFVDFDGATRSFTRPLVVLRHLGDVDANGTTESIAVNATGDENAIIQRFLEPEGLGDAKEVVNYSDYDKAVYRYRVCDVNNDSHLNSIDGQRIADQTTLTDLYLPTDYVG